MSFLRSPDSQLSPAAIILVRRELARRKLSHFVDATKPDYVWAWHLRYCAQRLDAFVAGKIPRLMILMPPRHGKTELSSRRLAAYLLGRYPDDAIIAASYSSDLAGRNSRDVQRIMNTPAYQAIFPGSVLPERGSSSGRIRTTELFELAESNGSYRAAGVGQGITGMGFRFGLIDDPHKDRAEADSPAHRDRVWEWYTSTFMTRQAPNASILICMTPWHQDDLRGRLLRAQEEGGDKWEVIRFPAIKEGPPTALDPRQDGEPLWPERYPLDFLRTVQATSGYEWAALYQLDPRAQGAAEWPDDYFGTDIWFDDWPRDCWLKAIALDPSKGADAKHGDYAAFVEARADTQGTVWVDATLGHWPAEQLAAMAVDMYESAQPDVFGAESNGFQELLAARIVALSRERGVLMNLAAIHNHLPKAIRIRKLGGLLGTKRLRFRRTLGARLLVRQLQEFPSGQHDDGPDALEMALRLLNECRHGRAAT